MSLAAIRDQLTNRVADISAARAKHVALPESPPALLPAVVTTWTTRPVRERYGNAPAMQNREHVFTCYVLIAQRRNQPDEDAAGVALAEKLLGGFEDNGRLDDTASRCDLTQVEPFVLQYGEGNQGAAFYGLKCAFTVRETNT